MTDKDVHGITTSELVSLRSIREMGKALVVNPGDPPLRSHHCLQDLDVQTEYNNVILSAIMINAES